MWCNKESESVRGREGFGSFKSCMPQTCILLLVAVEEELEVTGLC